MAFWLFILLNAVLFIRPGEIVPDFEGLPIYQWVILSCLVVAYPRLLDQFTREALISRPVTVCVVGVWVAAVVSHLARLNAFDAREIGFEVGKVILYYLLLMAVVDTPQQLRKLLVGLVLFIVVLAAIAVLQFHGRIDIPSLTTMEERTWNEETGEFDIIPRMRSTGIFNDPNDLCLVLGMGILISLYLTGDKRQGLLRFAWLAPIVLFGYSLVLTQSRGGLLGIASGLLVVSYARYGRRKTAALAMVAIPLVLVVLGGRQTNFTMDKNDTGHARIQLWAEGFQLLKQSPLFGIGAWQYSDEVTQVAHNSFVHGYVELGLLGGTLFVGAFFCALDGVRRTRFSTTNLVDPEFVRLRPYVLAMVVGYAVGLWSLSRNYVVPTYLVLGLASTYVRLSMEETSVMVLRLDKRLVRQLAMVSVACLVMIYASIRLLGQWG
jgi:hypothetical protein